MSNFWLYEIGTALGEMRLNVPQLIRESGNTREGLIERTGFQNVYCTNDFTQGLDLALETFSPSGKNLCGIANPDACIYVTSTSNFVAPGNAHLLQELLGLREDCFLLDLNDACTGFLRALTIAESLISSGKHTNVLIVLSDTYRKLFKPSDMKVSPLFSDAASSVLVTKHKITNSIEGIQGKHLQSMASYFVSKGGKATDLTISRTMTENLPESLSMNGGGVLNFVLANLESVLNKIEIELGVSPIGKTHWIVHQGSRAVVNVVENSLGVQRDSLFRAAEYGNTIGSSIPFQLKSLDSMDEEHEFIGLLGFGVGLSMGCKIVKVL